MKKISLILSLVLFMFLGGCLSKKTEQQLSEVPGNNGGTPEIKVDYKYVTPELKDAEMEAAGVVGSYYSFKAPKGVMFDLTAYEEVTSKEIAKKSKEFPKVSLNVSFKEISIDEVKNLYIADMGIQEKITSEKLIGNGIVYFQLENINGMYKSYEITTESKKSYFVSFALVKKVVIDDQTTKNIWYIATNISETNTVKDFLCYETLLRTLKVEKQNIQDIITGDQKSKIEQELFVNLNKALGKEEIRLALEKIYEHIEKYYSKEAGIPSSGISEDEKKAKIWDYANNLHPNVEFNAYELVRDKVATLANYVLKELEGSVAGFEKVEWKQLKIIDSEISYSLLSGAASKLSENLKEYEKVIQEQRFIEKKDGRLFTVQYILNGASSEYASRALYTQGVKYMVIAELIRLADWAEFGQNQGEEKNYQIKEVLRWYNIFNRDYNTVLKVMYETAIVGEKSELIYQASALDYVDKISIGDLYTELPLDYFKFFDRESTPAAAIDRKEALQSLLLKTMKGSFYTIVNQVGNYFTTDLGIYYMTKGIGELNSKIDAYSLMKKIETSYRVYLEKIKIFDPEIVKNLDIRNQMDYKEIEQKIKDYDTSKWTLYLLDLENNLEIEMTKIPKDEVKIMQINEEINSVKLGIEYYENMKKYVNDYEIVKNDYEALK